jgi:transposase
MSKAFDLRHATTAFEHDGTVVAAMELSGKSWIISGAVPGVARQPKKTLPVGDIAGVKTVLDGWVGESARSGKAIARIVVGFEAGRDGFWIARELKALGIEVYVMQASSIPVARQHRRAKTDRLDVALLVRTLVAWLRGEPRVCSMVAIPTVEEEDARRPTRERQRLVAERRRFENQMESVCVRFGIDGFNPRRKDADRLLDALHDRQGQPLPPHTMNELRRLLALHALVERQIKDIESARDAALAAASAATTGAATTGADDDRVMKMILLLMCIPGIAADTATILVVECLVRTFPNAKAVGSYAGITGTPFASGGCQREQGISKNGNPRLRKCLIQLAWRWLRMHPEHALSRWFRERTGGAAKGRIRKVMIVAMARKLLIMLWKLVNQGVFPDGLRLKAA